MIRIQLSTEDLIQTRFAFSPIWELVASYRVLIDPARHTLHLPWVVEARKALQGLDLRPLGLLIRPQGYMPDFLLPPPTTPLPEFALEIEHIKQTPPEIVRREVWWVYENHPTPLGAIQSYMDHPHEALAQLTELLSRYWERCLADHWSDRDREPQPARGDPSWPWDAPDPAGFRLAGSICDYRYALAANSRV